MNEPGWSKAPWRVNPKYPEDVLAANDKGVVCDHELGITLDEALANARLIAAAPELYRELDRLCRAAETANALSASHQAISWGTLACLARDALAKARGETMQQIGLKTNWFWQQGYRDGLDGRKAEIPDEARNMSQRRDYFDGYDAGQEDREAGDPPLPRE